LHWLSCPCYCLGRCIAGHRTLENQGISQQRLIAHNPMDQAVAVAARFGGRVGWLMKSIALSIARFSLIGCVILALAWWMIVAVRLPLFDDMRLVVFLLVVAMI